MTGDYEESPGLAPPLWSGFSTTRDECDGRKCAQFDACFVNQAKKVAAEASIIVTNYHLFFLHLRLGEDSKILPDFDVVIMDEAHNAAKIAREFFGKTITHGGMHRCVTNLHMVEVQELRSDGALLRERFLQEVEVVWAQLAARARAYEHVFSAPNQISVPALRFSRRHHSLLPTTWTAAPSASTPLSCSAVKPQALHTTSIESSERWVGERNASARPKPVSSVTPFAFEQLSHRFTVVI